MPITPQFLSANSAVRFKNGADLDAFFKAKKNADFIDWFNSTQSGNGYWGKFQGHSQILMSSSPAGKSRFKMLWDNIPVIFGQSDISILQFLSLMSIVNNETGGRMMPITEGVGSAGHPGIAYAFDKILNLKRSYNTLDGNKTAFDCFNDANFIAAFGSLPLSNLKNTTDVVWKGEAYPQTVATSTDPKVTGFVLQADFFKFRGRGFIQTTGRTNYSKIVSFVQGYTGPNAVILKYKNLWAGKSFDVAATLSSNDSWDDLFQNTELIIASKAISIHNMSSKNYLNGFAFSTEADVEKAIYNMGYRISGGKSYANFFLGRVTQLIESLS